MVAPFTLTLLRVQVNGQRGDRLHYVPLACKIRRRVSSAAVRSELPQPLCRAGTTLFMPAFVFSLGTLA
jgi:hypothetical protein